MSAGRRIRDAQRRTAAASKVAEETARYAGPLVARRAAAFGSESNLSELRKAMVGAEVVDVGFASRVKEGGFAVDFCRPGEPVHRVVLGYTELGEWVEYLGPRKP